MITNEEFITVPDYSAFRDRHYFRVYVIDQHGNKVYHGTKKQAERFVKVMKEGRHDGNQKKNR